METSIKRGAIFAIVCLAALSIVMGASVAFAAKELRFAHVYEVKTPYHEAALMAAKELEKATEGRYKMKVFPASSLGKEVAINEGISLGSIDVIYTGVAFASRAYKPVAISDYPFTMRGYAHWKAYRDSELFAELCEGYRKATGNPIVSLTYYGARHVTANKPILTPADMKGLKIRVPNAPAYVMFPKVAGANPTPMAFSEVYLALQQKVVDAQENPLPTIQFKKFYEVQKHINLTGHITNSLITIVSGSTLKKMGEKGRRRPNRRLEKILRLGLRPDREGRGRVGGLVPQAGRDRERGGPQALYRHGQASPEDQGYALAARDL
jgi:tripartite ATP-independent transporter DctP family solute receptor